MPEKTKRPRPTKKKFAIYFVRMIFFVVLVWKFASNVYRNRMYENNLVFSICLVLNRNDYFHQLCLVLFYCQYWIDIEIIWHLYEKKCIQNECGFNQWAKFYPWQIVFVRHQKCFAKRTKQMQKWWNSLQHFMHMQKNHNDDQNTSHLRNENELFQLQANAIYIRQNVRNSSQYHLHECICDRKSPLQFRSGQNIVAFSVY